MSLLKWKELATKTSKLGIKINYVHDTILKTKLGEKTSQTSTLSIQTNYHYQLGDVIVGSLKLFLRKRQQLKKLEVRNYGIDINDEVPDYGLDDLFDEELQPDTTKQLVPKPPSYEESLQDFLEGKKQVYMNPDIIHPGDDELPPEYDDEIPNYAIDDEDTINTILDDLSFENYESVEKKLNGPIMKPQRTKKYLNKIIKEANYRRSQLKGYKAHITKQFNSGDLTEAEKQMEHQRIDNARVTLNQYINHYKNKVKTIEGSRIKKVLEMLCFLMM